jgi:hypothetical protein
MKTYLFAPINNESTCLEIQLKEGNSWIDEIHVTELDRTFQGQSKDFQFNSRKQEKLIVHSCNADKLFKYDKFSKIFGVLSYGRKVYYPTIKNKLNLVLMTWYNEATQRNLSSDFKSLIQDDDIIILSDIDEIIDSRYADRIVEEVKKRGVITLKIHFTLFYLNLFSKNWGGPDMYSYRIFVMTGKYFKTMEYSSDYLRKLGENNKLIDSIYCPEEVMGFHHSWLGDEEFIAKKIASYAHVEHNQFNNIDYIKSCLEQKKSIFPNHTLEIRNDIQLLKSVEDMKIKYKHFFI